MNPSTMENKNMKKSILALSLIIGCASFSQANAAREHCLKNCINTFSSCANTCNKPAEANEYTCILDCQKAMDDCFAQNCGLSQFSPTEDSSQKDSETADKK